MTIQRMAGGFRSVLLGDGTAQTLSMRGAPIPATIWARPAGGDTITVSYSCDGVNFTNWPAGAVTAYTEDVLVSGISHIRFQRTAGAGTTSTGGVC